MALRPYVRMLVSGLAIAALAMTLVWSMRRGAEGEEEVSPLDELREGVAGAPEVDEEPAWTLPADRNPRVDYWIRFLRTTNRDKTKLWLERSGRYAPYIRRELKARGMPEDLVYLALIESGFSPRAYSRAHAVGIWQFVAATARRFGLEVSAYVDERRDVVKATEAALDYLQELYDRFGSWYLAAAAYNTGENRVERILQERAGGARGHDSLFWKIADALPAETRNYVPMLLAGTILGKFPDRFGFGDVVPEPPEAYDTVTVPDATELAVIARAAGVPREEVERLNPHFYRGVTPPGRAVQVRVPRGRGDAFRIAYARIPPAERVSVRTHRVRPGETLSGIALRYGTTVEALQAANRIRRPRSLRAGQRIVIPSGAAALAVAAESRPADDARDRTAAPLARGVAAAPGRARPGAQMYRVRPGDSLWSIARRFGVTVEQLRTWNGLARSATIVPGQRLAVRPPAEEVIVYRVQPGDTLWAIARRHGVSARDLMEWNEISEDALLRPGDELRVLVVR